MSYLLKSNLDVLQQTWTNCHYPPFLARSVSFPAVIWGVIPSSSGFFSFLLTLHFSSMYLNLKAYFRLLFFPSQKERNIKNHKLLFWILRVTTVLMFSQLITAVAAQRLKQLKNSMYILLNIKYCGLLTDLL